MKALTHLLFELSPWPPFFTAWSVGFCIVDMDGQVRITRAGEEYLDGCA